MGLSFECWSWNFGNSILIIIFNTYYTVLITFLYRHLLCLLQVIMELQEILDHLFLQLWQGKLVQKIVKQKIYLLICGVIFVLNRVIARQEEKK